MRRKAFSVLLQTDEFLQSKTAKLANYYLQSLTEKVQSCWSV